MSSASIPGSDRRLVRRFDDQGSLLYESIEFDLPTEQGVVTVERVRHEPAEPWGVLIDRPDNGVMTSADARAWAAVVVDTASYAEAMN